MEYEEMKGMIRTHVCSQCDGELTLIWSRNLNKYLLVCGTDHKHQGYTRRLSQGELFQRGRVDEDLGPGAQNDLEKRAAEGAPAISRLPERDIATGEVVALQKIKDLVDWGLRLGLKPYLGHVCFYFGKPYVTIDGYYYLITKERIQLAIGTRPLNVDERQQFQIGDGDHAWIAEAYLGSEKLGTTGLGIVTKEEIEGKSAKKPEEFRAPVVHGHPQRMAEKRAEWQLLRKLIPLEEKESPP